MRLMRDVIITKEPVELYKILKFEGLADNGGEAKAVIEQGLVKVNHVVEMRKRKQIVTGDVIEFAGETLKVTFMAPAAFAATAPEVRAKPVNDAKLRPLKKRAKLVTGRALQSQKK